MSPADPNELPSLSPGQLEIMDVIWRHGEATVAEVWKAVCRASEGRAKYRADHVGTP